MARHAKHAAKKPPSGMHKMPGGHMMPDKEMKGMMKPPTKKGGLKTRVKGRFR